MAEAAQQPKAILDYVNVRISIPPMYLVLISAGFDLPILISVIEFSQIKGLNQ